MKAVLLFLIGMIFVIPTKAQQGFVINHTNIDLSQVPDEWIDAAKANLKIRYFRRSHGSHVDVGGMAALTRYSAAYATKYAFGTSGASDELYLSTLWNSLDIENSTWYQTTRTFLNDPANADINVVMWAWSSSFYICSAQDYVDDMEALIAEFGPGGSANRAVPVTFVFQTACGQRIPERNSIVYAGNMLIRNHCTDNNRILFDFNDLECYDPNGNYFGDGNPDGSYTSARRLNDDLAYISSNPGGSVYTDSRNWGIDWMNSHPGNELTQLAADNICTICEHSMGTHEGETKDNSRLHCVLKGRAAWWLWARLAGWQSASVAISPASQLTETNLDDAVITLSLTAEDFIDNTLQISNFQLQNAPPGTTIESVSYTNSKQAQVALAFNGTDFDINYNNFSIRVLAAELQGGANLTSNTLSIQAFVEPEPTAIISVDQQLTESNLNGAVVHLNLENETFVDAVIDLANFNLLNTPTGCSIASIDYNTTTSCDVNIAFDQTDFDTNYNNFSISVLAAEVQGGADLTSNLLSIQAIVEPEPTAIISVDQQLTESNLNGAVVHLNLENETFVDAVLDLANFNLLNAPTGCSISSVDYNTTTSCNVNIAFDQTNFDANISNFMLEIAGSELNEAQSLQTNSLTINAVDEELPAAELIADNQLVESSLNGTVIRIVLSKETFFTDGRTGGSFNLLNAPAGLSISDSTISATEAELTLAFEGSDFDEDSVNFCILIKKGLLAGNTDLTTNAVPIYANDETNVEQIDDSPQLKLYPNPGKGNFSVEFDFALGKNASAQIIDIQGKIVYEKPISNRKTKKLDFQINSFKPGNYFFVLINDQERFVKTLIIH